MRVTDIRLTLCDAPGRLRASGAITLDGEFAVHGVKVIDPGHRPPFVSMPTRRKVVDPYTGRYEHYDICHPVTPSLREAIESAVLAAWREALAAREPATAETPAN